MWRRPNWGSVINERHCFETDLNRTSDCVGRRVRISRIRSSLPPISSPEGDGESSGFGFFDIFEEMREESSGWEMLCS